MSETSRQNGIKPEILPLYPSETDPGKIEYLIKKETSGADVLATVYYLEPDADLRTNHIAYLIKQGIERGALSNRTIVVEEQPTPKLTEEVAIKRCIDFGERPTMQDLTEALDYVYGGWNPPQMEKLLASFVDEGFLRLVGISAVQRNEMANATLETMAFELARLTEEQGGPIA